MMSLVVSVVSMTSRRVAELCWGSYLVGVTIVVRSPF